ncbi:putative Acylaminoacyl-peptidase [Frankia sp. AiPs1]
MRPPTLAADGRLAYVADGSTGPRLWIRPRAEDADGFTAGDETAADAGADMLVDTGPGHVRAVRWSPGGELLAVQVAPGGGELTEVRVVDPAARLGPGGRPGGARRLAGGDGRAATPACWTPDGEALLVTESDRTDPDGRTLALLVTLDGRRVVLAEGIALQILDAVRLDDGYRLLLREGPRGVRRALIVDARLAVPSGDGATHASWELPGGTATVLSGRFVAGGSRTLLVTDLGGRERAALLDLPVDEPGPATELAARPDADVERFALLDAPGTATARCQASTVVAGSVGAGHGVVAWNVGGKSELSLVNLSTGRSRALPVPPRAVVTALHAGRGEHELILAVEDATVTAEIWTCRLTDPVGTELPGTELPGTELPGTEPLGAEPLGAELPGAGTLGADYRCLVSRAPATAEEPAPGRGRTGALVEPVLLTIAAHDGLTLSGWWYRPPTPPGPPAGPMPTLLYLHGGPEAQDRPAFNPLVQALCARGIGVFAPNVRGSTGYGRSFEEADHLHGRFDGIEDVASCVRGLVAAGLADPRRVGVAGRSYGGYLTLAALVAFPDLFRVGVDICGMADLETFYQHTEPWIAASAVTKYGDPRTDPALLRALSPLHRMSRLAAPLLVVHGENDTNVPVIEAEQAVAAAQARGVPCRYLFFPDEGHEVVGLAGRVRFVRETVAWVSEYLLADSHQSESVA